MDIDLETVDAPKMETLDEEGLDAIHETSMQIVEDLGIKIEDENARELLVENGAEIVEDEIVSIPRGLVEDAIEDAPSSFTLRGRGDGKDVEIGGDNPPAMAPGYGAPNVRTFEDGTRSSTIEDYAVLTKLAQVEDVITVTGYNLCEPNDVPQEVKHLEMIERSLKLTDQPIMGSTYGEKRAKESLEMAGIANEDPDLEGHYIVGLINTISPRTLASEMTEGLIEFAKENQPTLIAACVMSGASGPATLAGSMALMNAEVLAGITIAQLTNPGVPVIYGAPSANVDVRNGAMTVGSPEESFYISCGTQMGRYYDIPTRAGGAVTDSKTVDDQSGSESLMQLLTTMFGRTDFVLHAAGILDTYNTISPEKFVVDAERIRYLKRFMDGYALNEETFAVDVMADVEPGSHFLNKRHTLQHCQTENFMPEIANHQSADEWESDGGKSTFEIAHETVETRLENYEQPEMDEQVRQDLEAYVEKRRDERLA